ncbi:MAG: type II toxin-antitoxin system RelE/ParE family toxin [Bdellovibrionales bacterium]|nr:type II toxin-antitoxin system RelE/ParE family toxin [Bdellovibrionales bacterium]
MNIVVIKQAQRELRGIPPAVMMNIAVLFEELGAGELLGLPISRPLPSIGKGLHELRLSGAGGEYRVFYVIRSGDAIYVIHAANKKKQGIDRRTSDLLKLRMRSMGL